MAAIIRGVGIAVPPYRIGQQDIKKVASDLFREKLSHIEQLISIFDNANIANRNLAQPLEWYAEPHSFPETNRLFEKIALELAAQASSLALERSGVTPADIGAVVFVTSTGISTPTLDVQLIQRLDLPSQAARLPLWGLGCAGGAGGLARSAELVAASPGRAVLLVAVELCSLTFQISDLSKANFIGSGIFADGAAAAVITSTGEGPEILGSMSTLLPDTEDIMGWDIIETGLKVRFSRSIPAMVIRHLDSLLTKACTEWGILKTEICHYVVHPGGAKVIDAYIRSLGLTADDLATASTILENYGNMSSASILFVLDEFLRQVPPAGQYGVMLALGPGFSAEQILFRW